MQHLTYELADKNHEKAKKNFINGYYYGELEIICSQTGIHFNWIDEVKGLVHESDEPLNYEVDYTMIGQALKEQFGSEVTIEFNGVNFKAADFENPTKVIQHAFWDLFNKTLPNKMYGPYTLTEI